MSKKGMLICLAGCAVLGTSWVGVPTTSAEAGRGTISGRLVASDPRMLHDAVVYVDEAPGHFVPHGMAVMDQRKMRFIPHVLPILQGTTVQFDNSDPLIHNVFTPDGKGYDLGAFGPGETRFHTFNKKGVYTQLCRIHAAMIAYIVVLQNPYFARTAPDGRFRIRKVPPGHYAVRAWQEIAYGGPVDVTVKAGADSKIRIRVAK